MIQIKSQNHHMYEALFPPFGAALEALMKCFPNAKKHNSPCHHHYTKQLVFSINHQIW
jgi:hypothetical protein